MLQRNTRIDTKVQVYCDAVLTSLLYGSGTWTLYRRHIKKLENFHLRRLRRISTPNGRIEYQTPLSLISVTTPASSRCCSELSFVGVAMSVACQMSVGLYPTSKCQTSVTSTELVSGRNNSFVSVSEPVKLTIRNGKNWQLTDTTGGTCAATQ